MDIFPSEIFASLGETSLYCTLLPLDRFSSAMVRPMATLEPAAGLVFLQHFRSP